MNIRRGRNRSIRIALTASAAALSLGVLSACGGAESGGSADGKLAVTASFYPLEFLVEQIGGDHVDVTTLTGPGVEPHDLDITPRQTGRMSEADVLLYLRGLQPAVDKAVDQAGVKNTVDAADLTTLEAHGSSSGDGHDHGEGDGHDHGEEEGHDHAEEEGDGHDHGDSGLDPHVWLDPVKYAEMADGVGEALQKADPDHAADYRKNTEALTGKLKKLDQNYRDGLKNTDTRTFITTHAAFGYLAERYGLDQESIAGVDPESEPSPARMKELQKIAAQEKVTTVFFETLASDRTAKVLAEDTGLRTGVLDPLEGITDKSQGDDYLEVMEANLAALKKALGAK
ncbi:metal ABC transporter substrate-binding protein [Streptomyces albidoflavus]|uniref:Zinc ABC transporter substrate-binding protein n=1 Tax=Streptomyces albidoflavus TaxID=1886 RepID=A0AB37X861_9ACTN|nr:MULTISPECIES: metal ABC transporter substrate-binding protein [Streptomyces]MYX47653.1 zinc ABC transporter solute-binding protein [Streptomyces sp. SID8385]QLA59088.1 zinc ABC transporter substrate-binding protein [Streptomyces violascens]BDH53524.1 zinc ABC transporter substrate-binding protein [Streptomyces albus]AWL32089.1 zinc ABC transporter substrate-binding protein [Streptomyces sp. SM17]EFE81075.1 metal transport system ABC transporter substrate-binding protein [Streptomyces albido